MLTIKQLRIKYKLTQKELAERIGVSATTISMYENGRWHLNQYLIDRIKVEFGEDIRPVKKKATARGKRKKKNTENTASGTVDEKYKRMADQFRKDGADEYTIDKFISEEMKRDAFEKERGTTDLVAYKEWQSWPEKRKWLYLNNAFCGNCRGAVSFADGYNIRKGEWGIVVEGTCAKCGGMIRRVCD